MSAPSTISAPITRLGLIGGSSFLESSYLASFILRVIETPFGSVQLRTNTDGSIVFVQRHAADPHPDRAYSPPHLINYKAIITALVQMKVSHVIAFGSTGSLKRSIPCGTLLVPDDWIHFTPVSTFDYAKGGHLGTGMDANLRASLLSLLRGASFQPLDRGVYTQTLGPRFETPAEIRSLVIQGGDIVGMTCAHEATLCKELGLPYALIAMVDNFANGIAETEISYEEFHAGVKKNLATMEKILGLVIKQFAPAPGVIAAGATAGKTQVDSVIHARYVVPIVPANTVYENYSLVSNGGKIVDLLPTDQAKAKYVGTNEESLLNDVLLPGFVNAHSHLGMTLMRGFSDDLCLADWLGKHIWPAERVFVAPDFVHDSCSLGLAELIRGGTVTINDMYWHPEVSAELCDRVGIRAQIGIVVIDFPSGYASGPDEYMSKGVTLYEKMKHHDRIQFALAPHGPYTVCDANLTKAHQLSTQTVFRTGGLPAKVHMHVHETAAEVNDSTTLTPSMSCHRSTHACRPFHNLDANLHILDENFIAVHMTQLNSEEIKRLGQTKSTVVHCATSNLKLASGFCPVGSLHSHGVNVALGTDSSASNNTLDMLAEVKLASILAKAVSNEPTAIPAFEALKMATLNGARALGIDTISGSLEVGKSSDFISIRLDSLECVPMYDVISHLVYVATREHVQNVWVQGKRLLRNRVLTTLDEQTIKTNALKWQAKLLEHKKKQTEEEKASKMDTSSDSSSSSSATAGSKRSADEHKEAPATAKPKI